MRLFRRASALLCVIVLLWAVSAQAQTAKVTFLLVNDIYLMNETRMPDGRSRGGFARLGAAVKAERAKGGHVILAHAGDTLSPSLMSGIDRGEHIVSLTNLIPPDIFVPGNHEFDFGKAVFLQRMSEARFALFAANLRGPDGNPLAGFQDRSIVTLDGVRIGLTGVTSEEAATLSNPQDLKFAPAVGTLKAQADALRREGADIVVAVLHLDRRQDYEVFNSRLADLILTGHDHDLFLAYDGRTAMAESSFDAHYVVAIDISIEVRIREGRRSVVWWPQFRVIDTADVAPDPEVAAAVKGFEDLLSREFNVALARTEIELDSRSAAVRTGEAAIGNLMADAVRTSTRADAALINGGGIRAGKIYPAGSGITRRDVLAELPFGNRVALLEIAGRNIRAALEHGLRSAPEAVGGFPQISGMRVEADLSRPAGQRIRAIAIGGAPLDDDKTYRLATNDFLARGGDGYAMLRDAKTLIADFDAPLLANEVMAYLRALAVVRTGIDGRMALK